MTLPDGTQGDQGAAAGREHLGQGFHAGLRRADETSRRSKGEAAKAKPQTASRPTGVIRFGMMAVRGVGEKAVEAIIDERTSTRAVHQPLRLHASASTCGTVTRGDDRGAGQVRRRSPARRRSARSCSRCWTRPSRRASSRSRTSAPGRSTCSAAAVRRRRQRRRMMADALPDVDELPDAELLKFEKELLGFYITSHPLTEHQVGPGALHHRLARRRRMTCSEGTEVTDRRDDQPGEEGRHQERPLRGHARWRSSRWKTWRGRSTGRCSPRRSRR